MKDKKQISDDFFIVVPAWAKDNEHEGVLTFLAFMYRANVRFEGGVFTIQKSDFNTIVGDEVRNHSKWFKTNCPESVPYLTIRNTNLDWVEVELKMPSRWSKNNNYTERIYIKDERQIRVWCFLLGAFKNNLVNEDPFKASQAQAMFNADRFLFKYRQQVSAKDK